MRRRVHRPQWQSIPWHWLVFAAVVFFACCCLHIGQSGKYSDDYAITMRNLATGEIDWSLHPWVRYNYFWRPLHLALLWGVGTVFWNHDWVAHTLSALAHAACALALAILLRRLAFSTRVSFVAALLFLSHTLHAEAINWFSTICVSLGALTTIVVFDLARRMSARGAPARPGALTLFALLAFASACWYESSAAALLALPVVFLAARPQNETLRSSLRRAVAPTIAAGFACVLYAALLIATAPAWQRGSAARMAAPLDVIPRAGWIVDQWGAWLFGHRARDLWIGPWIEAVRAFATPAGIVLGAFLVVAAAGALLAWFRAGCAHQPESREAPRPRLVLLSLAAVLMFLGAWLPIAAVKDNSVELRTWYTPLLAMALCAACVLELVSSALTRARGAVPRLLDPMLGAVVIAAILAGTLANIGWQRVFIRNWKFDERRAAELRAAIPAPPAGAVIMPLRTFSRTADTNRRFFDLAVEPALAQSWSCWPFVQRTFQRRDLTATHLSAWAPGALPLTNFSAEGAWSSTRLAGPYQHGRLGCLVPWHLAIPVGLLPDARLQFFDRITIERPYADDVIIRPSLTQDLPVDTARVRPIVLLDPDASWGTPAPAWSIMTPGTSSPSPAAISSAFHAGIDRTFFELSPDSGRVATVRINPAPTPRTLLIRWSFRAPPGSASGPRAASIALRAAARFVSDPPIETRSLDAPPQWWPLRIAIPASSEPVDVDLRADTQPPSTAGAILIHPGWLLPDAPTLPTEQNPANAQFR